MMLVRQWKEAGGEMGECQSKKRGSMLVRQWKDAGGDVGQTMEGSGW